MENLQKDSQEDNLWDLDEEIRDENSDIKQTQDDSSPSEKQGRKSNIPEVKSQKYAPINPTTSETSANPVDESPPYTPREYSVKNNNPGLDEDFDDLDTWDDTNPPDVNKPTPHHTAHDATTATAAPSAIPTSAQAQTPTPKEPASTPNAATSQIPDLLDTTLGNKNSANRRKTKISTTEKIGIAGLSTLIVLGIVFFMLNAFSGLPRIKNPFEMPSFPTPGQHLIVDNAISYWRTPITSGPDAETVQRGTELIPVVEITANSENATIRVQFRNSEGAAVGDPVTRPLQGKKTLVIPSTAGLEDMHTHSAYRTGNLEPWTAEILEAPAGTTTGSAFQTLTTIPILPNRR